MIWPRYHYLRDFFLKELENCFQTWAHYMTPYQFVSANLRLLIKLKSLTVVSLTTRSDWRKFNKFKYFISELLIRWLRVFLYLFKISTILDFLFAPQTAYLNPGFQTIVIIRFWHGTRVSTYVLPWQGYVLVKHTPNIGNIMH